MCVPDKDSAARARAEALFKLREFHKADAPVALRDYREAQRATLERMREQRARRLAYEAQLARES